MVFHDCRESLKKNIPVVFSALLEQPNTAQKMTVVMNQLVLGTAIMPLLVATQLLSEELRRWSSNMAARRRRTSTARPLGFYNIC
jgi:hypothetical protein